PGILGEQVPWPYGAWDIEAMDAHGGWIAAAPALARFAAAFNDPKKCPILTASSVRAMFAPPPGPPGHKPNGRPKDDYYASGWSIVRSGPPGSFNAFHGGKLDGTSTIMVRRSDRITWAVLFNATGLPNNKEPVDLIDGLVHEAADAVKVWPTK